MLYNKMYNEITMSLGCFSDDLRNHVYVFLYKTHNTLTLIAKWRVV